MRRILFWPQRHSPWLLVGTADLGTGGWPVVCISAAERSQSLRSRPFPFSQETQVSDRLILRLPRPLVRRACSPWRGAGTVDDKAAGGEQIYISAISLGELSFGVESCSDPATRMVRIRYLSSLQQRPVLDVSSLTASAFGILGAFMKQLGRSPRTRVNDIWIAAQAMENDYALLTANLKDFEGLPGLRVSCP